jgi:hypothetical protein
VLRAEQKPAQKALKSSRPDSIKGEEEETAPRNDSKPRSSRSVRVRRMRKSTAS